MVATISLTRVGPPDCLAHVAIGRLKHHTISDQSGLISDYLSDSEREEWAAYRHPERQAEWLGARICLKRLMLESVDAEHPGEICVIKNERGRPQAVCRRTGKPVAGDCSLTHAKEWSAAAWTTRPRTRIGIDVERVSERLMRAAGAFVTPEDRGCVERTRTEQLAIWWSLKEAGSKVIGLGLGAGLAEISCVELDHQLHRVQHASGVSMVGWHATFDDFVIAVCASDVMA